MDMCPSSSPTFVGVTVLRWEINIRESTIIGIVGGGGIGFLLNCGKQAALIR